MGGSQYPPVVANLGNIYHLRLHSLLVSRQKKFAMSHKNPVAVNWFL